MSTITYTELADNLTTSTDSTAYLYAPPAPTLTEEACLAAGGHCYEEDNFTLGNGTLVRTCKHCGKKQYGTPQQDIRWEDV